MTVRAASGAHRHYYRAPGRVGVFGLLGRLVGLVITAVAVGIFLKILGHANPGWFNHVRTWFEGLF